MNVYYLLEIYLFIRIMSFKFYKFYSKINLLLRIIIP